MLTYKKTVEAFVFDPREVNGGSKHTGVASVSVRQMGPGMWALYSYHTCVARRWGNLVWISSRTYSRTTSKQLGALQLTLLKAKDLQVFSGSIDPHTKEVAEGLWASQVEAAAKAEIVSSEVDWS